MAPLCNYRYCVYINTNSNGREPPQLKKTPFKVSTHPVRHRGEQRTQCEYCFRPGHTAEVCYRRTADERQEQRQERMLIKVLTEGLAQQQMHHPEQPFQATPQPPWQHQPGHYPSWNDSSSIGLRTNVGDLSHNFVLRQSADVVAVTETWLSDKVEPTFGRISGYSPWVRKDREFRAGGGVAACFKDGLQTQELEIAVPRQTEALFFRMVLADKSGLLFCVMYRPPRQGRAPLDFLTEELDTLLQRHKCSHVMLVGDLNPHMEQDAYNHLLVVQGLVNHVTFPTHERGGMLDPVVTDLPEASIRCQQLGPVGSSDHFAVLSQVELQTAREDATPRTIWLWDKADWPSMKQDIENTDWEALLVGDADARARALTTRLLALQQVHVPSRLYLSKPGDPAWFGFRCRASAEDKHAAWVRYKRHPTPRNKTLHWEACKRMLSTCRWAKNQLREDRKRKLSGSGVGNKTWWRLVREQQGACQREALLPLTRPDGSTATSTTDKATLLAEYFANKMMVDDPARPVPQLAQETDNTVTTVLVTEEQVERLLGALDESKATGPDDVSPRLLKHCARELTAPLTTVFTTCLKENKWPSVWKEARVVPVNKKTRSQSPPTTDPSRCSQWWAR
ncbi:uncharacterized protein LOC123505739 [Portunus trituberculatus]|uniref:uncharacterized protein LOC123505739 n=1 Tax=Portunus trituberculatus TaxID=210409 RepID=UPI001E1CEDB2|nr:uncharacterized protein LOC123505739 [Portunus trituberculatus]